ncbi:MAG: cytochrome c [Tunicatimonas sp.]
MNLLKSFALTLCLGSLIACSSSGNQEGTASTTTPQPEPEATPAVQTQALEKGKTIYNQYCLACHQGDGNGVAGAFPPLTQTKWVAGDKATLISVILNGMQGEIVVKGETYNNAMPAHGFLSDEEIGAVLTYVRQSFGNDYSEITTEEVAEVRASATN